jgi:signal transduction histidine kinase
VLGFHNLSIRSKLTSIIMVISSVTLLLACAAFVGYDRYTFRRAMVQDLSVLAEIIGSNSTAALTFNDANSAREILRGLSAHQHIQSACIYGRDGRVFAYYIRNAPGTVFLEPEGDGGRFGSNELLLFRRIWLDREQIGTVYLQSDLAELRERTDRYVAIVVLVVCGSLSVAFVLSSRLQRTISEPIRSLAWTTKMVRVDKNYSIRAVKRSEDELGLLIEGFNDMLQEIQRRDIALQQAHDDLEKRVDERTRELQLEVLDRTRAERELASRAEELARSNSELQRFAYVASHDLQEPLRMVASYTQLLARRYKGKLDADANDFINFAVEGATRMQQLIKDLLAYSRVSATEKALVLVDANLICKEALFNLRKAIEDSHATLTIGPLPQILADASQLGQVFQNLVSNAIKYGAKAKPEVRISAQQSGEHWRFSVQDNGIGIEPQYFERIFQMFQRLHTREQYSGTGIGLTICRKIVERHGGKIWVESHPGKGSTFLFSIPVGQALAESKPHSSESQPFSQPVNL